MWNASAAETQVLIYGSVGVLVVCLGTLVLGYRTKLRYWAAAISVLLTTIAVAVVLHKLSYTGIGEAALGRMLYGAVLRSS